MNDTEENDATVSKLSNFLVMDIQVLLQDLQFSIFRNENGRHIKEITVTHWKNKDNSRTSQ